VTVTGEVDGLSARAEIEVSGPSDRAWSFENDIVPLLTRQGCNTGGCHGRADGQNGFRLSLFGYNPAADYESITREMNGRRIDRVRPESSLLLLKATGQVTHGGSRKIVPGSPAYNTLAAWITAGAPQESGDVHGPLVSVGVEPKDVLRDEPRPIQLRVVAKYSDGHERDVTRLASFRSNDDRVVAVDERGLARMRSRGETDVIVRYGSRVVTSRLASPINPELDFDYDSLKRANLIDKH